VCIMYINLVLSYFWRIVILSLIQIKTF
jgi:hypothetical protein